MPNPDGTPTPDEMRVIMGNLAAGGRAAPPKNPYAGAAALTSTVEANRAKEIAGRRGTGGLSGYYGQSTMQQPQDQLFGNLSQGEALAKMYGDFGLGSNNNAETTAMLGAANATGDKYSSAFGGAAANAGAAGAAAAGRGTDVYAGDTGSYQQGLAQARESRNMQTGAYGALMDFANTGPGPSAAQAQLTQATDANTNNALALARSGRGMGGGQAGLRQALGQNAATQQSSAAQMAELRANENTAYQQQRLAAIGQAGGVAGQTVQGDQNYGQLGLAGAQYQSDTALKGTQLNDAAAQGWADRQSAALQQGMGAEMGAQTQGLNINSTALAGRESEWASANQTHGIDTGNATQAGIADANRQQAYVGAGLSTAGTVMGALSDERTKTNIVPLGNPLGLNGVKPLASQAPSGPSMDPVASKSAADAAQKSATGSAVGGAAGSVVGGAVGSLAGPIGTVAGGAIGNIAGKALGKVFSDVRSKENIVPLSGRGEDAPPEMVRDPNNPSRYISPFASIGKASHAAGAALRPLPTHAIDERDPYEGDPFDQLVALGAGEVATTPKAVEQYANASPKALAKFSRADHPILSEGDALLANSARSVPGSVYDYKNPTEPGAKPGRQVGPMAQDLAANPLTRGTVVKGPKGKLAVDAPRLTLYNTAAQHAQQNQLDHLGAKIEDLASLLKRKPADAQPTDYNAFNRGTAGL